MNINEHTHILHAIETRTDIMRPEKNNNNNKIQIVYISGMFCIYLRRMKSKQKERKKTPIEKLLHWTASIQYVIRN